jgi:hypothetical protein
MLIVACRLITSSESGVSSSTFRVARSCFASLLLAAIASAL